MKRLLLLAVVFVLLTAVAHADEQAGCSFSGIVKLDDSEVAAGTLVTAIIQGDEYHTHTPPGLGSSSYSIIIQPPEGKTYPDGAEVAFRVNGQRASQTGVFKAGASQRLDLAASTAGAPAGGLNLKLLIGIAAALLVVAGVAYYLGRLRPASRAVRAPSVQGRAGRTVRSEKGQPREATSPPPRLVVHLKQTGVVRKPAPRRTSIYSQGVLRALAAHGVSPDRTVGVQKTITCPGCRRQFMVMVPKSWIITVKPHLADGAASYSKMTSKKELFEFDVVCPRGHRIHLDWDWITPPAPRA